MDSINNKKTLKLGVLVVLVFFSGWLLRGFTGQFSPKVEQVRQNTQEFKFINPLLFTDDSDINFLELDPLKNQFSNFIDKTVSQNKAKRVSVYFRDLDKAKWTGVNTDDTYAPSSMLKVLTLISYLRYADMKPGILLDTLSYRYQDDPGQFYKPKPLADGNYSVLTLLQQLIIESDNSAMKQLNSLNIDEISEVYSELRVPNLLTSPENFLSPRTVSGFFRSLYNSSYISHKYSEGALELLTYTKFDKGLVAGVITGTKVAHKFGEHTEMVNGQVQSRQLHDCGIIYYPKSPYLLCVMTEGQKFEDLEGVIAGLSQIAYQYVKNSH